jgi:hypothetical protein
MKKNIFYLILIGLIFTLAACSSADAASPTGNAVDPANGERQFEMSTEMTLMLGTVKLDETDFAVDVEQAAELLPLWKALRSLSESDTAANVEIEALISQIGETMTPEQMEAIESMGLSMQDMNGVMETLGIEMGGFGDMSEEMQATMEAAQESGDFPGGGDFPRGGDMPPGGGMGPGNGMGGGGGFGGGAELDSAARATAMAERGGERGIRSGLNTNLLDAIIEFLEAKIQ